MQRASDLLGMPVATGSDSPWGKVCEVYVDFPREQVGAFSVTVQGALKAGTILATDVAFGSDFLSAEAQALCFGAGAAILRQGKVSLADVRKLVAVTTGGQRLGTVADLVLAGMRVVALELSEGLVQDLFEGRYELSLPVRAELARGELIVSTDNG